MYKKLTDQEVKELSRDFLINIDFVISHVGDGEYTCNIFGNIYSSYWQALKKAREKYDRDLAIYVGEDGGGNKDYYICETREEVYTWHYTMPAVARLTKETINSDFDLGQ